MGLEKYFEITLAEAQEWSFLEYFIFIVETLYSTIFPFVCGMLMVARQELIWLLGIAIPIYFRLKISKHYDSKPKKKKIYVR